MKIVSAKINGIVNPIGYDFDKMIASWKVTETGAEKQSQAWIEVASDEVFHFLLKSYEGNLNYTGAVITWL